MKTAWACLLLAAFQGACSRGAQWNPSCRSDAECGQSEVCFPDGCGDPGQNLVAEVTPNSWTGNHAQDLAIPTLHPEQDLELAAASSISGVVQRATTDGGIPVPYADTLRVAAQGESLVLPGIFRRFESNGAATDGTFSLPVSPGKFTVTFTPADTGIPAQTLPDQMVAAGMNLTTQLTLEADADLVHLNGKVVRTLALKDPVLEAALDIQAVDAQTLFPISQTAPVSSGQPSSTGDFNLVVSSKAKETGQFLLQVTPHEPGAPVPFKNFPISLSSGLTELLELGAYSAAVQVTGVVRDFTGLPVASATVEIGGPLASGSLYVSPRLQTDSQGHFSLPSLVSDSLSLSVSPPPQSTGSTIAAPVSVPAAGKDLGIVLTPARPKTTGRLLLPDGSKGAAGVQIFVSNASGMLMQPEAAAGDAAIAQTDGQGNFTLQLDGGFYRLDFVSPDASLPRVSRFVRMGTDPLSLGEIALSLGRTVHGRILARDDPMDPTSLRVQPLAAVRFFRVVTVEESIRMSVLLAEGVSDKLGNYSVVLPTR